MKALLVMDMQNVCVGKNHAEYFKYDTDNLIKEVNQIIEQNEQNVVVYIRNLMKKNIISKLAPFQVYDGMKEAELAEELRIISDNVYDKYVGDAFTNPELDNFLKSQKVSEILIVGIDGGGCVALTALGAIKKGYKVTLIQKAIGTMFTKRKEKYYKKLEAQGAKLS